MPTLDWLNRAAAFTTAARVPYRLLEQVSIHTPTAQTKEAKPQATQTTPVQAELVVAEAETLDNPIRKEITDNLLIQGDTTAPCGFALATSRGRFFPDFVAELVDGRVAVVEYKGAHLPNDPYEIEKRQIGELWARKSQGRRLFGQIAKERDGVGMSGQLDALLQ